MLLGKIKPDMVERKKRKREKTPNSDIDLSAKLSMALQWFMCDETIDMMKIHGVGRILQSL